MVMNISTQPEIRTISAAEFKAKCLQLMDDVHERKLTLIVTKRGKPVMRAVPPEATEESFVPLWGRSPNVKILGDIMAPIDWGDPGPKWKKANKRKKAK